MSAYVRNDELEPVPGRDRQHDRGVPGGDDQDIDADSLKLVRLAEFVTPPSVSWYVRDLLPAGALVVVFGPPKSGKTFAVCDLVMHAAHGMHWCGYQMPGALRVAFLAGEGRNGLRLRLKAWRTEHGAELKGDFRLLPEAIGLPQRMAEVVEMLADYMPNVVVIDTLNAYFGGGDENSTQDMTVFVAAIRHLMNKCPCSVVVIHHTGLADATRARGSGVLRAAADVVIQVAKDDNGSGLIAFQLVEGRDIEGWERPLALKLRRVATDWRDDQGHPLTTCVVEAVTQPVAMPSRGTRPLTESQCATVEAVRELAARKANGGTDILLVRSEIIAAACAKGVNRTVAYRNLQQLAPRMGWQLSEPGSLKVPSSCR